MLQMGNLETEYGEAIPFRATGPSQGKTLALSHY